MKSSNSSLNTSTESIQKISNNNTIEINPLAPKRYYGNITLDMIDDFLNPLTHKKDQTKVNSFKIIPGPTTNGRGLFDSSVSRANDSNDDNNKFFCQRENKNNIDYAKQAKKQFEKELIESAAASNLDNSMYFNSTSKEDRSIVGSGMSQIESVTTMNVSMNQRLRTMTQAKHLANINDDNASIDFNNNSMSREVNDAGRYKDISPEEKKQEDIIELAKMYKFRSVQDTPNLPITEKRQKIVSFIDAYPFSIIRGGTGCGKTTQVPQYILDDHIGKKKYCNIIVTQPRRIAAISVAKRVCSERSWTLGDLCGYQIGLERVCNYDRTRITYVTTGVLLQKLIGPQAEENFEKYTHIIIDEVHERDLETDFVLLVVKLKTYRNLRAKIILMSATIDCDLFSKYYAKDKLNIVNEEGKRVKERVPILDVESNFFNVQEFYWDDLVSNHSFLSHTIQTSQQNKMEKMKKNNVYQKFHDDSIYRRNYGQKSSNTYTDETFSSIKQYKQHIQNITFKYEEPEMSQESMNMCINLLRYFDDEDIKSSLKTDSNEIELNNLNMTLSSLNTNDQVPLKSNRIIDGLPEKRGSVLIFVPGMHNIQTLNELISKEFPPDYLIDVLPLHSEIPLLQQQRVFTQSKPCHRKVIISTSIAESSITVSDIKYVIDFCLTKELYSDPNTNYTHLRQGWASKSSLAQRRGRAGRVSDGTCYRLITRDFYNQLEDYTKAAILREPLSRIILNVKRLNLVGDPKKILSMAIEPPKLSDIERTILLLKEVGALTLNHKREDGKIENDPYDGDLTYAGKIMANLPIDVRLTKLILLGHAFGKLKEAITIAAGLSTKTIFTSLYKSYFESYKYKWLWAGGWMCDCLAILNVCKSYEANSEMLYTHKEKFEWTKKNNIEFNRLNELLNLRHELEGRLNNLEIKSSSFLNPNSTHRVKYNSKDVSEKLYDLDDEDQIIKHYLIIKMMIAGAFYPNYLNSCSLDLNEAYKMVGFHDIKNTVQVKNLPNQEGILYSEKLNDLFRPCSNAIVRHFEDTKAYIEFKDEHEEIKSNINFSVYLAVEMRLLRLPLKLRRYIPAIAQERLRRHKHDKENICDVTIDKTETGVLKFSLGSVSSLNRTLSARALNSTSKNNISETESISSNHTLEAEIEEIANDSDSLTEFVQTKEKVKELDQSKFFACATVINTMTNTLIKAESMRNIETSSRISGSVGRGKNSIIGSNSNISVIKKHKEILTTNRYSTTNDSACSIIDHLRNPKFLFPEVVDMGEMVNIIVTEVVECGHFWAQISDDAHIKTLENIQKIMNKIDDKNQSMSDLSVSTYSLNTASYQLRHLNPANIYLNGLCVSIYSVDRSFYRAQIININKTEQKATVLFIDYGNKEKKSFKELFEMSIDLYEFPFQAVECKLANIQMSILKNPNSIWTKGANDFFQKKIDLYHGTETTSFKVKIIDLVDTVAMVKMESLITGKDLGDEIVSAGYAKKIDLNNPIQKTAFASKPENVVYMPTRQSDHTSKRPNVAGGAINQDFGQFNVRSKISSMPISRMNDSYRINETDNYDDYDHDDISLVTESSSNSCYNDEDGSYAGTIDLNGPYSPLEVNYYPLVNIGRTKKTRVSRGSINHVTLDDDPFNQSPRLMISSEIFLNSNADTMVMRNTTLMPKLAGLTSLCCLLFSPVVEFRVDDKLTSLTGALCGLGSNNKAAIFTDNDIEITFDVNIDLQDIKMINQLRLAINTIIGNENLAKEWTNDDTMLKSLQQKTCKKLLDVIERNRRIAEPKYANRPYKWNQINPDVLREWNYDETKKSSTLPKIYDEYYSFHQLVKLENI